MKKLLFIVPLFLGMTLKRNMVEGTVLDNMNEPLTGVEINVDGKTYYTDFDGKFSLFTFSDSLEISHISFEKVEIPTNQIDTIIIL